MTELRRTTPSLRERLEQRSVLVPFSGCRMWLGASVPSGYGVIANRTHGKRQEYTHRTAWELAHGPIPKGMFVLHECDVPACINADHLFIGSPKDNMHDMIKKGRAKFIGGPKGDRSGMRKHPESVMRGEKNYNAKLTQAQVDAIREMYRPGVTRQVDIAEAFGIKQANVSSIIRRTAWK